MLAWLSVWGEVQICILPSCLLPQEIQTGFGFTSLVLAHRGSPGHNPESRRTVVVSENIGCEERL